MTDIWRALHPDLTRFTWRNKSLKIQSRLDYFLVSQDLSALTKKCKILQAPESDHSAVSILLQSEVLTQKRGPGFWKFNNSLLEDSTYIESLRKQLLDFKAKYNDLTDLGLKWDLIKMEIRGYTVKYSKQKAKEKIETRNFFCKET